jgi:hypothetical protein
LEKNPNITTNSNWTKSNKTRNRIRFSQACSLFSWESNLSLQQKLKLDIDLDMSTSRFLSAIDDNILDFVFHFFSTWWTCLQECASGNAIYINKFPIFNGKELTRYYIWIYRETCLAVVKEKRKSKTIQARKKTWQT